MLGGRRAMRLAGLAACALALAGAAPVEAQPGGQQTLQIEEIDDAWVIGPDFRVTDVESELSTMAGVYGGRLLADRLLIGAGAYWLLDGAFGTDMHYAGPLVEWSTRNDSWINVSLRGLVGFGSATRRAFFPAALRGPSGGHGRFESRFGRGGQHGPGFGSYYDDFFVAEPHVGVFLRGNDWFGVNLGAGYRFTGGENQFDQSLSGASFSIGFRFGG